MFQLRKKLFGHKRSNSDTEDLLCPFTGVDTPLSTPSVSRENSQNGRPGLTRNGSLPRTEVCNSTFHWPVVTKALIGRNVPAVFVAEVDCYCNKASDWLKFLRLCKTMHDWLTVMFSQPIILKHWLLAENHVTY